jgi:hypothetical protein
MYPGPDTSDGLPTRRGLLQQGPIEGMDFYSCILEPAGKPTHSALGVHGAAVRVWRPGRQTDFSRRHEADNHPGQGLEMPPIGPVLMLAKDVHQRIIEMRPAFHADPPWKTVVPKRV